jgi:hypothetical protein
MNEQAEVMKVWEVLNTKLFRLARRMQRVRKQKKTGHEATLGRAENGRLTASIRVAAEKDLPGNQLPHNRNGISQSGTIFFGVTERRPGWLFLPEGQITSENEITVLSERFAQRD